MSKVNEGDLFRVVKIDTSYEGTNQKAIEEIIELYSKSVDNIFEVSYTYEAGGVTMIVTGDIVFYESEIELVFTI